MCREIVQNAAPTLAGLKTGNLFTVCYEDKKKILQEIRDVNVILSASGILAIPLRFSDKRVLIYVYRINALGSDMREPARVKILDALGYPSSGTARLISELRKRLLTSDTFPHEVGLFLGYPTEDVLGFMENRKHGYKMIGTWKVYGDENAARVIFEKYSKCTQSYIERFEKGTGLEKLVVA